MEFQQLLGFLIIGLFVWGIVAYYNSISESDKEVEKQRRLNEFGYSEHKDNGKKYIKMAKEKWSVFCQECNSTVPHVNKHEEATFFRHAWRRAQVLMMIFEGDDLEQFLVHKEFAELARESYYKVAPTNAYGSVVLKISPNQSSKILKQELLRLGRYPKKTNQKYTACIYKGLDTSSSKIYIGQTINHAEIRFKQHRDAGTGPFKGGAVNVNWDVVKSMVPTEDLDYWESYYIGYYNSFEYGYNDNKGNDINAYQKGLSSRK